MRKLSEKNKNASAKSGKKCRPTPAPPPEPRLDLEEIRRKLASSTGPRYWRSLEELARTPGFEDMLEREFPRQASEWRDPVSRRNFLQLMGASLALAGLSACTKQPPESIVPYVRAPEEIVPGNPLLYATAMTLGGAATPLLVESNMGRPTKVEGNPEHPASLGATDIYAQASVLTLYDPDRSQTLLYLGEVRPWGAFLGGLRNSIVAQRSLLGAGLRFLTETVVSPSLGDQLRRILRQYPQAKWHQYDPINRDNAHSGSKLAFGEVVDAHYRLDQADVIVSLDADFLSSGYPGFVRYARDFASRRKLEGGKSEMSRMYVVESTPSNTGAKADHRMALRAAEVEDFARWLAGTLGIGDLGIAGSPTNAYYKWIVAVARDLQAHRGSSVVIAGDGQSPAVHALAHAMNQALGNVGKTVVYAEPVEANPVDQTDSLRDLVQDLTAGKVDLLVILGGNPVYNAPADLNFAANISRAGLRVRLGLYEDETSALCQWHVPEAHYLESWGDTRAYDGTVSIQQPLIAPLYGGKSPHEILGAFTDEPERSAYNTVREYWTQQRGGSDFEQNWRRWVHDGFIPATAFQPKAVSVSALNLPAAAPPKPGELEVVFRADPTIYDGRFANNGWLQELPKPHSTITWDNAALISPKTAAERLGPQTNSQDVVEIVYRDRRVKAPLWITPGHADDSVTVYLGYGRTRAGRAGTGAGFSAYALRTSTAPWSVRGVRMNRTGEQYELAVTQGHNNMEGRDLVRSAELEDYRKDPQFARHDEPESGLTLYQPYEYKDHAWGMAIDLNSCVGCNACVVACQAENNIPVVGKFEVQRGREMQWIRIDRYYEGDWANPRIHFQPVPCMQCENAPCEPVCPVGATVHSAEGLNDMVYNRCVGTRYCSNNCPYKVRRFNFLLYSDYETESLKLLRNPEVTVRSRGVMEKCTYCVQRINRGRIEAEKQDRKVADGEVLTACQQACPAGAIIFGDINDSKSRVAQLKAEPRNYALLAELNTRPRTTYLAEVRNPNPELEPPAAKEKKH
ncbi:MAG TPA: TAT-variant-translocated molybdopterin oxidoreductase [Terriglobales bacterium]|nr:TAT-variant-translocated molybdopterin oxidoreductase [Terriglobales bacterium]